MEVLKIPSNPIIWLHHNWLSRHSYEKAFLKRLIENIQTFRRVLFQDAFDFGKELFLALKIMAHWK